MKQKIIRRALKRNTQIVALGPVFVLSKEDAMGDALDYAFEKARKLLAKRDECANEIKDAFGVVRPELESAAQRARDSGLFRKVIVRGHPHSIKLQVFKHADPEDDKPDHWHGYLMRRDDGRCEVARRDSFGAHTILSTESVDRADAFNAVSRFFDQVAEHICDDDEL